MDKRGVRLISRYVKYLTLVRIEAVTSFDSWVSDDRDLSSHSDRITHERAMPLESQTEAATVLGNGVSPKSGRRGFWPKSIASLLARLGLRFGDPTVEDQ